MVSEMLSESDWRRETVRPKEESRPTKDGGSD